MLSARAGTARGGEDAVLSNWQGSLLLAGEDAMFGSNFFFAIPADQEGFLAAGLLGGVAGKSFGEQRGGAAERIVEDAGGRVLARCAVRVAGGNFSIPGEVAVADFRRREGAG
jgi:hypothetical protein